MRTLSRAVARKEAIGTRIKLPWYDLERYVTLYTKQLAVIGGGPGGGKSTIAINMLMNLDYPALYIAQDSEQSVLARMAALALGIRVDEAFEMMARDHTRTDLARELQSVRPSLVIAGGTHTTKLIDERLKALREWIGHYPRIIVLDNVIDTTVPGENYNNPQFYSTLLPELKNIALKRDCLVLALHHVIRRSDGGTSIGTGTKPLKMTDMLYAGERETRHVWGVYNKGDDRMMVQVLKQTDGPRDPEGSLEAGLVWAPEYARVSNG